MWLRPVMATLGLVLAPLVLLGCTDTETPPGTGIPVLTAISPATAPAGSPALTLILSGEIFYDFSVVRWAGGALQTTFVSDTELRAEVPASLLVSPGTFDVTVETIAPGGGTSPPKPFLVQAVVLGP